MGFPPGHGVLLTTGVLVGRGDIIVLRRFVAEVVRTRQEPAEIITARREEGDVIRTLQQPAEIITSKRLRVGVVR